MTSRPVSGPRDPVVGPRDPASNSDTQVVAPRMHILRDTSNSMSLVGLALGLLAVAWPLAWAPVWAYVTAAAGVGAVLARTFLRRRPAPAIAVTAAIASAAFSRAGAAALAAEGLFILGYLLAVDAPRVRPGRWLRSRLRLCVAAVITTGAVLAALALHPSSSAWLAVAGLAAAVAAYLAALPSARRGGKDL